MSQTIGEAIKLVYEHEGKINDILNNYMTTDTPQTVTGAKYFPNGKAMFENYIIASGYTISFPQRNGEIALASDINSIRANYVAWIQGYPSVTHEPDMVSYLFNVYNDRSQGSQNILQNFSFNILSATTSQAGLMSAADKVKVNNIASDIATALSTAKTYTDGKTERTYLVNTIGEATTSQSGLLSAVDKTKINNIAGDISTALNAAKTYTDSKVARENLVAVLGEATTTLNGLMSATDKERLNTLYALLGESGDPDQFVNTISEILEVFETYPEGANIATILAGKINYSDVVDNLSSNETVKPLSANQGRILKGMVDQKVSSYSSDSTQWDTTPTSGSTKPVTSGGIKAANDALAADITALGGRTSNLETSVSALQTNKADKADTYNKTETEARLAEKQDTLVSGDNIKTLNGTSLLGSGDYAFDSAFDEESTNSVQNKVISKEVKELNYELAVLREAVFEVVLSEIDYTSVFTDSFVIPDTLTDTDGTHRVVFSETELKKVAGNSVVANQFCNFDFVGEYNAKGVVAKGQNIKLEVKNNYGIQQSLTQLQTPIPAGHKVFYMLNKRSGETTGAIIGGYHMSPSPKSWQGLVQMNSESKAMISTTTDTVTDILLFLNSPTSVTEALDADFYYSDLTQMFGIGNEPTTTSDPRIQWLIKYLENNPDYDTGTIKSSIINGLQSLDSNDEVIGTITIPPTEIKSAGTAQDYIEVVEGDVVEGEQLYNLVKTTNIGTVDLGTLNWNKAGQDAMNVDGRTYAWLANAKMPSSPSIIANAICNKLLTTTYNNINVSQSMNPIYHNSFGLANGVIQISYPNAINYDMTVAQIKEALNGIYVYFELATPTQTTIATNLHFSEISMLIAEGGKIKPLYDNVPVDTTLTFVVKKAISE